MAARVTIARRGVSHDRDAAGLKYLSHCRKRCRSHKEFVPTNGLYKKKRERVLKVPCL